MKNNSWGIVLSLLSVASALKIAVINDLHIDPYYKANCKPGL